MSVFNRFNPLNRAGSNLVSHTFPTSTKRLVLIDLLPSAKGVGNINAKEAKVLALPPTENLLFKNMESFCTGCTTPVPGVPGIGETMGMVLICRKILLGPILG